VREDYSTDGNAWDYFSHDQARSRVYRRGEDGLAGVSDDLQLLCFGLALWNGSDPILKERLFGLTNSEGNHGEDVKEYYFHLDSTPTHSYMRMLYKYPQAAYPYEDLVRTNRERSRTEFEYELLDTGVFDEDRYFDVFVEYAKGAPDDLLCRITVANRGPNGARLHVLPTVWWRNTWGDDRESRPRMRRVEPGVIGLTHAELGTWRVYVSPEAELLFTENETNVAKLWGGENPTPFVKDGINDHVVAGLATVNPMQEGTKASAWHQLTIAAGSETVVEVRLRRADAESVVGGPLGPAFGSVLAQRQADADEFYESITPPALDEDAATVMRRALAGMLWTKQWYGYDVDRWLDELGAHPMRSPTRSVRNQQWFHMRNADVLSMPDKWEYPWYAAWDLAFHCVPLTMVDPAFARRQLELMLSDDYLHPSGQIPAYEWNFGDVNPPVHAWATLFAYSAGLGGTPGEDLDFLQAAFRKLLLNFTWWINRKDPEGRNVYEGGFLGLDNIGVFDRSAELPTGGHLEQADGTAWMALFSQNMLELSLELATRDPSFEEFALKFVRQFFMIAASMDRVGVTDDELWDEEDGFFYDVLRLPDGSATRLRIRSLVGLLPLCAATVIPQEVVEQFPALTKRVRDHVDRQPDLLANIADPTVPGVNGRRLLSILDETKLRRMLARMLDEKRFLSPHGIRSLSRWHLDHPYVFDVAGQEFRVDYLPAESNTGMFGGNSNWRGPVWFPVNLLIIRALLQYYLYYGDEFTIECPTGSGRELTLFEVAKDLSDRLTGIFLRDGDGRRPVYGDLPRFQGDPHWRDLILFHEYFHGDNGAGLGASHQTGWTGAVAKLIQLFAATTAEQVLIGGTRPVTTPYRRSAARAAQLA
jgi:hypothetical protein